jgi:predicted DNA-binding WGR domain protein
MPLSISLQARNPSRNVHRAWHAEAAPDLFGIWLVQTRYGRIGTEGRRLARSFPDEAAARAYLTRLLRRRATAPSRIGVAYRPVTTLSYPPPCCPHVPEGCR